MERLYILPHRARRERIPNSHSTFLLSLPRNSKNDTVMKKILALSLLLSVLALGAGAQNQYWNYMSYNVPCPKSAVSVVHSNQNIYYFQSDPTPSLSITKIDPSTMTPTGTPKYSDSNYSLNSFLMMDGGFEDSNGSIVIYGHVPSASGATPAYAIVDPYLNSLVVFCGQTAVGTIVDGCEGYDTDGRQVYMFVMDNGQLLAVGANDQISITPILSEYYTDISWDSIHHFFIATGTWAYGQTHPGIIVDIFNFESTNPALGTTSNVQHSFTCFLNNNSFDRVSEHQAMHVQLDERQILVCRDLREDKKDILWMTRISDYWNTNCTVQESYEYKIPTHKLLALDLLYDPFHLRVNFLGEIIYCTNFNTKFLSQVNPYKLYLGMNAGQLDGTFAIPTSCPSIADPTVNIYGNVLSVSNLALNIFHECVPVMIAGVSPGSPNRILTETYDISQLTCDYPLPVETKPIDPYIVPYSLTTTLNPFPFSYQQCSLGLDIVASSIHCSGWDACPPLSKDSLEIKAASLSYDKVPIIDLKGTHQFVCQGFDGKIQYYLYDMTGRTVVQGTTYNDIQNLLPNLQGVFILKAIDKSDGFSTKKIILFP